MYNIAKTTQEFWTAFGQYMAPVRSSDGGKVSWLNYRTGIRQIYFKMRADRSSAYIAIELKQQDPELRRKYYDRLLSLQSMLEEAVNEKWTWEAEALDDDGNAFSRVYREIAGVNILEQGTWPGIISFLKTRIMGLDLFWTDAREILE